MFAYFTLIPAADVIALFCLCSFLLTVITATTSTTASALRCMRIQQLYNNNDNNNYYYFQQLQNYNKAYSYSRYRTGTSLQGRLMRGSLFKCKSRSTLFNDIPPHKPPLHASSSPIPGIRIFNNYPAKSRGISSDT